MLAGTTSIAGSEGEKGLLRNLDKNPTSSTSGNQEGLNEGGGRRGLRDVPARRTRAAWS